VAAPPPPLALTHAAGAALNDARVRSCTIWRPSRWNRSRACRLCTPPGRRRGGRRPPRRL